MNEMTPITLNLQAPNVNVIVHAKEGDRAGRFLNAKLVDGAREFIPPENAHFVVRYMKADGNGGLYDTMEDNETPAVTLSGNIATIGIAEQALTVPGLTQMELNIYDGNATRISAFKFNMIVEETVMPDGNVESTEYFNILTHEIALALQASDVVQAVVDMTVEAVELPQGSAPTVEKDYDPDAGTLKLTFGLVNGVDGKTAYQSAVDGGYTGTEAEFNVELAGLNAAATAAAAAAAAAAQSKTDIEALVETVTGNVGIDDDYTGAATTWSSNKIQSELDEQSSRIDSKQDLLTFDNTPTKGSTNPVTSGGIYNAINPNETELTFTENARYALGEIGSVVDVLHPLPQSDNGCLYTPIKRGESIKFNLHDGSTTYRSWAFLDSEYKIISKAEKNILDYNEIFAPVNAAYAVIQTRNLSDGDKWAIKYIAENRYAGLRMSLLGDSFSAFEGYSDSEHNYYPHEGSDVSSVDQMWWKIVADKLHLKNLVIGAWSGSTVASGLRTSGYRPASNPLRCEALDNGTYYPDVVLIAMGVNDYSYAKEGSFGTWDGTTALGAQSDLSDYDTTTFRAAYATMLARIQHKYPNATIVCITPWFQERYETDTGVNYLNSIGKSISDYADAIKEIGDIMHVFVVDGTNIGFNRHNYYPKYAKDSASKPTHPTIAGQKHISEAIINCLNNIVPISN